MNNRKKNLICKSAGKHGHKIAGPATLPTYLLVAQYLLLRYGLLVAVLLLIAKCGPVALLFMLKMLMRNSE